MDKRCGNTTGMELVVVEILRGRFDFPVVNVVAQTIVINAFKSLNEGVARSRHKIAAAISSAHWVCLCVWLIQNYKLPSGINLIIYVPVTATSLFIVLYNVIDIMRGWGWERGQGQSDWGRCHVHFHSTEVAPFLFTRWRGWAR